MDKEDELSVHLCVFHFQSVVHWTWSGHMQVHLKKNHWKSRYGQAVNKAILKQRWRFFFFFSLASSIPSFSSSAEHFWFEMNQENIV